MPNEPRRNAAALLAELGLSATLTVYVASSAGAGKTYRLLADARADARAGRRVAIGWIETKGRPDLDELAADLPRIPPKTFMLGQTPIEDFDLEAALASDAEIIVLDELAHSNPSNAPNSKRWQDANALREAGKSVLGALNVMHLDSVAVVAERVIGYPIREIVPLNFLRGADRVVALDVSSDILEGRLRTGRIVPGEDILRAASGPFAPQALHTLRQLMLRTVDELTVPVVAPSRVSTALLIVDAPFDQEPLLRRVAALANAMDLALEVTYVAAGRRERSLAVLDVGAGTVEPPREMESGRLVNVRARLVCLPRGPLARKILARPIDRDCFVADPSSRPLTVDIGDGGLFAETLGDRMRIGYGKLTIFFGSAAGSGKTFAMLDRAAQLNELGVDVVGALVETHGRSETQAKVGKLEIIPRLAGEIDLDALLVRRPQIVLIDELAHSNTPDATRRKRYDDVLAVLRAGIDVMTTLNVQHLEGLGDAVERLTGTRVRETLPDRILEIADDVIFIDATPEVLRQRLREGKVYPPERVDTALANFFQRDNLAALRELAVRELLRARDGRRHAPPFARMVVAVAPRPRDRDLILRIVPLAKRLGAAVRVVSVFRPGQDISAMLQLESIAKQNGATFARIESRDVLRAIQSTLEPGDVLALESPRRTKRLFGKTSFAARALDANIGELLVLAPRAGEETLAGED